ncbi:MAG: protein kinase [Vicinamibacterales bacterium]
MRIPGDPTPGRIGPYHIVGRVGAGGMGEVFKGWDPRLNRDVAIKVLHPDGSAGEERRERLLEEGRAASALNHPNILRVYEPGTDGTSSYLVSEWLEGGQLRDEMSRGPLSLQRLLDLAVQIADGLAAAHAQGIVHRDIKPENIMLARDGSARIVDFGIAALSAPTPPSTDTQTSTVSFEGGLSGTPAYMSPEQARGLRGDFRTDQFSFGVLLYEMATGVSPFRRGSPVDTMAAVLEDEPKALSEVNPRIPVAFRWIVEQCMAKDPADRYSSTEDLARELRRLRYRRHEIQGESPKPAPGSRARKAAAVAGAGAIAMLALTAGTMLGDGDAPRGSFVPFASAAEYEGTPAWSPDGQTLAYVQDVDGVLQLFVKRVGDALGHQVTQGRFDAERPFWSANGQFLYFISLAGEQEALWSVGVAGGRPELVLENVMRAAVDPDGTRLAMFRNDPQMQFRESLWWLPLTPEGQPIREARPPFDTVVATTAQLAFSRDGQLLVWLYRLADRSAIATMPPDFYVIPKDGGSLRHVFGDIERFASLPQFSWLPDNRHIVLALPDDHLGNRHLWLADTRSSERREITATHTNESDPAVSPDGRRIAYASDEVDFDLVLLSPDGGTRRPLLATARNEFSPAWSPSGDRIAFVTDRSGSLEIYARSRDGQFERPIVTGTEFGAGPTRTLGDLAFSPDGSMVAYQRGDGGSFEIWLSPVNGGTPVRLTPPTDTRLYQSAPAWSPDGEWIAYAFTEQEGLSQSLRKARVGAAGESVHLLDNLLSFTPVIWSADGQWIYCETPDGLSRVSAQGGEPELISSEPALALAPAEDGQQLYVLTASETSGHFALARIEPATRDVRIVHPDLGPVPIANQSIRGFSFLKGEGFLTSMAKARSDIWLIEDFAVPRPWPLRLWARAR